MVLPDPALEVRLLGGFQVAFAGQPVPDATWRHRRSAALVKLLALAPGHRLHREQAIDALWPELDPDAAANNLRVVLHRARQRLQAAGVPADAVLTRDGEWLALGPAGQVWVDSDAFEAAVKQAWRTRDPGDVQAAVDRYEGDLLPEDAYEPWADERRAALRAQFLTLLAQSARHREASADYEGAVAAWQRLLAHEPLDEDAHAALMRALTLAGQRQQALQHYARLESLLERELGVEPERETRQLAAAIRERTVRPAPRTVVKPTPRLHSGTVAFLLVEIEEGAARWQTDPEAMAAALPRFEALVQRAVGEHDGQTFRITGDTIFAAFAEPSAAVAAATEAQRALLAEQWAGLDGPRVRMALHSGAATLRHTDYVGPALSEAAALLAAGHGGQILVSHDLADGARSALPPGIMLRDLGRHRPPGLRQPERIYQVEGPRLPASFPTLRTPEGLRRGLPAATSALIGREREVAETRQLLAGSRLVTLTGPGGVGKTRLALAVAAEADAPDGARFVDLAPLREADAELVLPTVARALGALDPGASDPLTALMAFLAGKHLLLVLDNFEHLLAAAPEVSTLLAASPRLKVLVTSRAPLRLRGEQAYPVPPLSLPRDDGESVDINGLLAHDAVALFVQRAREALPDFSLTPANAAAVAAICRQLDGLPLAIELAAARVRLLPAAEIQQRLARPLHFLRGGPRDLPARQQSLRQAIDWSYDLLSETERTLFARLAIFSGGTSLAALEAVCADADADNAMLGNGPVEETMAALVEQSLVRRISPPDASPRLTMLATLRDYARERLEASADFSLTRARHAAYFLALAEEAEPALTGPRQRPWLDRLEEEHDNLRAALATLRERPDPDDLLRLGGALWRFWWLRGYPREGRRWLAEALERGQTAPADLRTRASALDGAGVLAEAQGDYDEAAALHEEALALYRALGDDLGSARSLENLGIIEQHDRGNHDHARRFYEEALALYRASGDEPGIASALGNLGNIALWDGNYAAATALFNESLQRSRVLEDQRGVAIGLGSLGALAFLQERPQQAADYYEESLALWRDLGEPQDIALTLGNLGEALHHLGQLDRARQLYDEALPLCNDLGDKQGLAFLHQHLGKLAHTRGDDPAAIGHFLDGLNLCQQVGEQPRLAECLEGLAGAIGANGDSSRAARLFGAADAMRETIGTSLPAALQQGRDADLAAVRTALAPNVFARAWEDGRRLSEEEAIAEASVIGVIAHRS